MERKMREVGWKLFLFSLIEIDIMFRLFVLLLILRITLAKLCGTQKECRCYFNLQIASCTKQQLKKIPLFTDLEKTYFNKLYLRWNLIKSVRMDPHLENLELIDLRNNPLKCESIPQWKNIHLDCINKLSTSSMTTISPPKKKQIAEKSEIMQRSTQQLKIASSHITLSTVYHSITIANTLSTDSSPGSSVISADIHSLSTRLLSEKVTDQPSSFFSTSLTSDSDSLKDFQSSTPKMEKDNSLDFYLHVTLGPIGVLYVLASIMVVIRIYLRRRFHRRNISSSMEM